MTVDTVSSERREHRSGLLRGSITGFVLMMIVVLGTYYGWQAAFRDGGTEPAADGCQSAQVATTTLTPGGPTSTAPTGMVLLPSDVSVTVLNSTSRAGLANNTAVLLSDRGFDVTGIGNDSDVEIPEVAQIRAARADLPEALLVLQHVPGAVVVADGRADLTVDIVLGEAFTSLGDPATVTPVPIATTPRCRTTAG